MARQVTKADASYLNPLARRLALRSIVYFPAWVTPNQITTLGFASLLLVALAYYLASFAKGWLLVAVAGLIVHWLTDHLDGEFARARGLTSERGFFLDQFLDTLGASAIVIGIACASYTQFPLVILFAVLYLHRVILTLLVIVLRQRFVLGRVGPSEMQLLLIVLALLTYFRAGSVLEVAGRPFGWFDLAALAVLPLTFTEGLIAAIRFYRELEPPPRHARAPEG